MDKPDAADPTKEPYNFYRFNAKRFDPASGTYDMGFRDYDPGLNRYLTRDLFNGALADLDLATDPFTGNRYAFAGGNPITGIELDGHVPLTLQQLENINTAPPAGPDPTTQRLININTEPPASSPASGASKPGPTPIAGFVRSPAPAPVSVAGRIAAVGGTILGILAGGLLLGGDTPQGAQPESSPDTDLQKKAKACLEKSGSEPSDAPVSGPLDQRRATSAERCIGQDATGSGDRNLNLRYDVGDWTPGKVGAHLLAYGLGGSNKSNNGVWAYKAVNDRMQSIEQFAIREKNKGLRVYSYVQALYRPGSTSKDGPYALRVYVQTSAGQG